MLIHFGLLGMLLDTHRGYGLLECFSLTGVASQCLLPMVASGSAVSKPGPEVIKLFSCSTQMSMKFSPLIYVKMPTIVGILTCMSGKNSILGLSEPKKC